MMKLQETGQVDTQLEKLRKRATDKPLVATSRICLEWDRRTQ